MKIIWHKAVKSAKLLYLKYKLTCLQVKLYSFHPSKIYRWTNSEKAFITNQNPPKYWKKGSINTSFLFIFFSFKPGPNNLGITAKLLFNYCNNLLEIHMKNLLHLNFWIHFILGTLPAPWKEDAVSSSFYYIKWVQILYIKVLKKLPGWKLFTHK